MSMTEQFNVQPAPQRKVLGIEFGSTRIKAVLTDGHGAVLATGSHTWENQLVNGIWTYPLEQVWNGLQACYRDMADRYRMRYGSPITVLDAIGFSGMMHGYLAFDRDGNQLVPFRTWRNTITDRAADLLTKQFSFNIPQLEHRAPVSGDSERGSACFLHRLPDNAGRIRTLAADRRTRSWRRRGVWHVPDRQRRDDLRRRYGGPL